MLEVEGLGVSYFDLRSANVLSMVTSATVFSSVISLCLLKSTVVSSRAPTGRTVSWWPSIFYSSPSFSEWNDAEPSSTNLLTCWRESPHQNECYRLQCFFMDLGFSGCRYLRHLFLSICHRWGLVQLYLAWFGGLEWCCSGLQLYAALTGEFIWSCYFLLLCSSYFVAELLFLACFHFVAKWYSEPPDRLIAMLEGFFDHFCAQFPEALNKTNPQGLFPMVYHHPFVAAADNGCLILPRPVSRQHQHP